VIRFPITVTARRNTGTEENSFNSLLSKLAELRYRHEENHIDLFQHLESNSQKKISLKDLIFFLGSVRI